MNPPVNPPAATCNGKEATITGTDANDNLKGTEQADVIQALGGDDKVNGADGNDVVCGGDGKDKLKGGRRQGQAVRRGRQGQAQRRWREQGQVRRRARQRQGRELREGTRGEVAPGSRKVARVVAGGEGFEEWQAELHGHSVVYRMAGSGPAVVLIHGMINSSRHWRAVAERLAVDHTVIAPDLIGHGDSATPRGDYSIGAHATAIRDLLSAIGVRSATIVGHSLGGGVAMQFFWQFPERVDRLVLISSGGLGPQVSPLLHFAAMPGASPALALAARPRVVAAIAAARGRARAPRLEPAVYVDAVARALRPLQGEGARRAFLQTLRAVIDVRGQRVSAVDRLYLLGPVPSLIVWGERDRTIPLEHGRAAHAAIPHSRFETLPRAAHFPHLEDPEGLTAVLVDFLATTEPFRLDADDWEELLSSRTVRRRRLRPAA